MAYVVTEASDGGKILSLYPTLAAAQAGAAADEFAQSTAVTDMAEVGWMYVSGVAVDSLETDPEISERRMALKELIRNLEKVPGLATWIAGSNTDVRAKTYARWVEMIARASSIDDNLEDDTKHATILAEASIDGRTWYWLHSSSSWGGYFDDDRGDWNWYSTAGTSTTPDSRGGLIDTTISVRAGSNFDWVSYLGS